MPRRTTELLKAGWYYLGTYFKDDQRADSTGTVTLLARHYEVRRGKTGIVRLYQESKGFDFPDDDAMVEWIEEHDAIELPAEADGDPHFIPEEFERAVEEAKVAA
jgi:hypothetical protein